MASNLRLADAPWFVDAPLTYLADSSQRPTVQRTNAEAPERSGEFEQKTVSIYDGRPFAAQFALDRDGFAFRHAKTALTDFDDEEAIRAIYYPEVTQLVKEATGASDVFVFDHTIRIEEDGKREDKAVRAPVQVVHNDYTEKSGPVRIRDLLPPDIAEAYLAGRVAQVNVWRPIGKPVETTPLAVADAKSIAPEDFVPTDLVYGDRTGEVYQFRHNPNHRWFYFPKMTRDEALLLKGYDSKNGGTARFTPHTAFSNPEAPADAPPRESIEVRTFVSFGGQE